MTHNTEVSAVMLNADLETIEQLIETSGRSRYPVYDKNENDVIGILHAKDFFIGRRKNMGLKEMLRPAYFVPENCRQIFFLKICKRKSFILRS